MFLQRVRKVAEFGERHERVLPGSLGPLIERVTKLNPGAEGPSFSDSVRIPWNELMSRVHELPPPHEIIKLLDVGKATVRAQEVLSKRKVRLVAGEPGADGGRLWEPSPWVAEIAPTMKPARVLDLGCGSGRDAVFLASLGWEVTAMDRLPEAVAMATELAQRYDLSINGIVGDVFTNEAIEGFDLILSVYFHDPRLPAWIAKALAPGGKWLVEAFTPTHRAKFGKPSGSAVLSGEDLENLGFRIHKAEEAWRPNGRHTLRALLELG